MTWSDEEAEWVAEAYHADYVLSQAADPVPREVRDQHWWAVDRVQDAGMEGTLTIRVVDALLRAGELAEAYRGYVAAGPLEDLLGDHGGKFDSEVTARCKVDAIWAEAAQDVWVNRKRWEGMPRLCNDSCPSRSGHGPRRRRRASARADVRFEPPSYL